MLPSSNLSILLAGVLFLAWSNGANDNFKGVATLYGSGTTSFRGALVWATVATGAGSLVSIALAGVLAKTFSGSGLVDERLIDVRFLSSVGLAAAVTIALATRLGMPTSATHALTGALVGVGLTAAGLTGIAWNSLLIKFAQPLLLSPLLAIGLTRIVYPTLSRLREHSGIEADSCACVAAPLKTAMTPGAALAMTPTTSPAAPEIVTGKHSECDGGYAGTIVGIRAQTLVDVAHYASGGAVCFARAVNDTPKIAALMLAVGALGSQDQTAPLVVVAVAMGLGGWLQSRRVAETMSRDITDLNTGQGLTANLVTAFLVLGASRLGVPVSTTHVSCGTIFGIGWTRRAARWRTISKIVATWVTTLPLGAALGALVYRVLAS